MRYIPTNNRFNIFDDMFDNFVPRVSELNSIMKTDVYEKDGYYSLDVELPGYTKQDVSIDLEGGYLKIQAKHEHSNEETNNRGQLIRQERTFGTCSRSFYVGDNIKAEDVQAKFENGILNITLPSKEQKAIETRQSVSIL